MGTHPIFESDFDCLTDDLKMTFTRFHMNGLKELEMENDRFGHFIKISNRIELYNLFYKIQESQNKSES